MVEKVVEEEKAAAPGRLAGRRCAPEHGQEAGLPASARDGGGGVGSHWPAEGNGLGWDFRRGMVGGVQLTKG
jgi:hypothetical protein